jgi:hypothetical protein
VLLYISSFGLVVLPHVAPRLHVNGDWSRFVVVNELNAEPKYGATRYTHVSSWTASDQKEKPDVARRPARRRTPRAPSRSPTPPGVVAGRGRHARVARKASHLQAGSRGPSTRSRSIRFSTSGGVFGAENTTVFRRACTRTAVTAKCFAMASPAAAPPPDPLRRDRHRRPHRRLWRQACRAHS